MKKILIAVIALSFVAVTAQAQEKYVAGGFEAAGHVNVGAGYQHFNNRTPSYVTNDGDVTYYAGPVGKYLGTAPTNRSDHFSFFVDEVELDLMKSFGENVRLRADLDFGRVNSSGRGTNAFTLEQAYATANIPLGNGIEFLLGRFNAPIGFEAVDMNDNDTISFSMFRQGLRPANMTGVKIYYAFSDLVDLHFYVVNTLYQDSDVKINDVPSMGFRLGFNWGEEGTESTFGVSGMFGPESNVSNKHFTFGGDIDLNWWLTESFALGFEGLILRSNTQVALSPVSENTWYFGGLMNLHYVFSDVWDGTLRYAYASQKRIGPNGALRATGLPVDGLAGGGVWKMDLLGDRQQVHQITLAGGYAIADGAKLKLEGRFDIVQPSTQGWSEAATLLGFASGRTQYVMGGALAFCYDF
ncbi:MAG TPA: outer membrane beta-barrel protein [bacterium]|nr:outer membrane beta-barrel protein [bacterium]